jgi:hypothetical protein
LHVDARIYQLDFVGVVLAENREGKGCRISSQRIGSGFSGKTIVGRASLPSQSNRNGLHLRYQISENGTDRFLR